MRRADEFMQVIDHFYAAAVEPAEWAPALEAMTDFLDAGHIILAMDGDAGSEVVLGVRVDEDDLTRFAWAAGEGMLGPLDPARLPPRTLVRREELVPAHEFARADYYNEIIKPLDGFHSAFYRHSRAGAGFKLAVCRPERAQDFSSTEIAELGAFLPHIANAVEIRHRLAAAQDENRALLRLLDCLDAPLILVDSTARPVFVNRAAARIVEEGDGLAADAGGLAASTPQATRELRMAVAALTAPRRLHDGTLQAALAPAATEARLLLERPSLRAPMLLTLLPLWRTGMAVPGAGEPRVAILIAEPDAPAHIDTDVVADAFHLTARETEIALLLGKGRDLAAIAVELDLSRGTVRNHLKRIFDKTGAHSQATLVTLVRGFAARQG